MKEQQASRTEEQERDRDFFKTPNIVIDSRLLARMKPSEAKVYSVLSRFADYKTGSAFPSIVLICNLSGMNKNVVCKAIKRLEYFGLVKKYRAPKKFKYRNVYRVIRNPQIDSSIIPQKMEKGSTRIRGKNGRWRVA